VSENNAAPAASLEGVQTRTLKPREG